MDDKELIRVDLLKFRRKAYLSYADGSKERKNFLKVVLQNELQLTKSEIPQDLINLVMEGDKEMWQSALKNSALWVVSAILFASMVLLTHSFLGDFSFVFVGLALGSLTIAMQYIYEYWRYRKSVQTVRKYSNDMQKYIGKLANDIKKLDGPHGQ